VPMLNDVGKVYSYSVDPAGGGDGGGHGSATECSGGLTISAGDGRSSIAYGGQLRMYGQS
jgi:hypothetical protein